MDFYSEQPCEISENEAWQMSSRRLIDYIKYIGSALPPPDPHLGRVTKTTLVRRALLAAQENKQKYGRCMPQATRLIEYWKTKHPSDPIPDEFSTAYTGGPHVKHEVALSPIVPPKSVSDVPSPLPPPNVLQRVMGYFWGQPQPIVPIPKEQEKEGEQKPEKVEEQKPAQSPVQPPIEPFTPPPPLSEPVAVPVEKPEPKPVAAVVPEKPKITVIKPSTLIVPDEELDVEVVSIEKKINKLLARLGEITNGSAVSVMMPAIPWLKAKNYKYIHRDRLSSFEYKFPFDKPVVEKASPASIKPTKQTIDDLCVDLYDKNGNRKAIRYAEGTKLIMKTNDTTDQWRRGRTVSVEDGIGDDIIIHLTKVTGNPDVLRKNMNLYAQLAYYYNIVTPVPAGYPPFILPEYYRLCEQSEIDMYQTTLIKYSFFSFAAPTFITIGKLYSKQTKNSQLVASTYLDAGVLTTTGDEVTGQAKTDWITKVTNHITEIGLAMAFICADTYFTWRYYTVDGVARPGLYLPEKAFGIDDFVISKITEKIFAVQLLPLPRPAVTFLKERDGWFYSGDELSEKEYLRRAGKLFRESIEQIEKMSTSLIINPRDRKKDVMIIPDGIGAIYH